MYNITQGIKCKACDKSLSTSNNLDSELCNDCMQVVFEYNQDLLAPADERDAVELVFIPDYREESIDYARKDN